MNLRGTYTYGLLFLLVLGCIKEPRPSSPLGPPTTVEEIEFVQSKSISKLDPYSVEPQQRVHGIETIEVISSQNPIKNLSQEWVVEVTEVENFENRRLLTTLKSVSDKTLTDQFVYEVKNVYAIPQLQGFQILQPLKINSEELLSFLKEQNQKNSELNSFNQAEDSIEGIAFHNLKSQEVTLKAPPRVQKSKDCQGLSQCQMSADKITYDVVFLFNSGKTQTHNVEWFISHQVPFFAGILKQCATTIIPVDSARVLVKQCSEVVDFKHR